ncbi:AMP-binding protein [Pseudonocardia sp. ICBG601]|uniref:AMP-binding protein n=1 Tax=Pseudonocardia sp. ICBG601 TaxID=2846759 RepID=UPI001CF71781|nr:AMP-binding protein [Pseudonocardia sp. ICBG601]
MLISHAHAYTYASREDQARPVPGDRILVTLPLFHLAGQWFGVYQAIIHRALCVLEPSFSVSRFWPTVREHGVTVTVMLGAMAELLQQAPHRPDDAANPLELAVMAPLASDVDGFRTRFGSSSPRSTGERDRCGCSRAARHDRRRRVRLPPRGLTSCASSTRRAPTCRRGRSGSCGSSPTTR